jgi:hypothetical protein
MLSIPKKKILTRTSTRFEGCCTYLLCMGNGLCTSVNTWMISQVENRCTYTVTARRHRQSVGSHRRSCKLRERFEVSTCRDLCIYLLVRQLWRMLALINLYGDD